MPLLLFVLGGGVASLLLSIFLSGITNDEEEKEMVLIAREIETSVTPLDPSKAYYILLRKDEILKRNTTNKCKIYALKQLQEEIKWYLRTGK